MSKQISLFLSVLFLVSCSSNSNQTTRQTEAITSKIEVTEFTEKLNTLNNVQLVDVRTPEEFSGGAIPKAINVYYREGSFDQSLGKLNKDQPVMLYCQSGVVGGRSGQTMQKLKDMGFKEIYELAGGYSAWEASRTIAQKLDSPAFAKKLKELNQVQLIDVRTPEECAGGIIEGAVNYNFHESDFEQNLATLNKNQAVMVYCKSGGRSGKTMEKLKSLGFKEVYDLKGGYTDWAKQ